MKYQKIYKDEDMKILCNTEMNSNFLEFHFDIITSINTNISDVAASRKLFDSVDARIIEDKYNKMILDVKHIVESYGFTIFDVSPPSLSKQPYDAQYYRSDYFKFYSSHSDTEYPVLIDLRISDHTRDEDFIKEDSDRHITKLYVEDIIPSNILNWEIEKEINTFTFDIPDIQLVDTIFNNVLTEINSFVKQLYQNQVKPKTFIVKNIYNKLDIISKQFSYDEDEIIGLNLDIEEDKLNHILNIQFYYDNISNKQFKAFKGFMDRYMQIFDMGYVVGITKNSILYKISNYE